jgi:hypothetical protein
MVMSGILYDESSFWEFFFITCILGGWAAWMTGKACAQTWRPYGIFIFYMVLLSFGVRFIHHALFAGTMEIVHFYVTDFVILLIIGSIGYRYTRTEQMTSQYHWLYEKTSLLSWKAKA